MFLGLQKVVTQSNRQEKLILLASFSFCCCAFHLARSKDPRCPWAPLPPIRADFILSVHIGTHLGPAIELIVSQLFLTPAPHHSGESEKGGVLPEPQLEKVWLGLTASPDLAYGSPPPTPLCRAKDQSFQPSWKQKTGGKPPIWLIGSHTKVLLHNLSPEIFCSQGAPGSRQCLLGDWKGSSPNFWV